jgi:nucleoid-associated protein YgaU
MTRETKIGLLVGLAFVIVIGILLSDHITRSMQPPQAALAIAGENVREGIGAPGAGRAGSQGDVRVPAVIPDHQVRTHVDNATGRASVTISGGPAAGRPIDISDTGSRSTNERVPDNIIIPSPGANEGATTPDDLIKPAGKQYIAEGGDNLRKIARRMMGADTQANRDAIVKANPSLQRNPNKIIAGQTYLIPTAEASHEETASARGPATRPGGTAVVYTTKSGDSLWTIAKEQVGSGSAVAQIREMNRDVLRNGDAIKPNMKLKLPPKQVASAN